LKEVIVLGAAGTIGQVIVRDLVESGIEVIAADIDFNRLEKLKKQLNVKNLEIYPLDIKNQNETKQLLEQGKVCINATNYMFNIDVMQIAAAAKVDLLDLGGLYTMTKEQLKLDAMMKEAGVLSITGMGSDPGISNVLSRYGVDMMDEAEEIHIRYGSTSSGVTFPFAIDTVLDEATKNAMVVRNGQLYEIPPLSEEEDTIFNEQIGIQKTFSILHSELATLPISFPTVKEITYKDTWDLKTIEKIKLLDQLGLLQNNQVNSIRKKLVSLLRESINEKPEWGKDELLVEVKGYKNGKKASIKLELLCDYQEKWGVNALAYVTSIPASIVAQMLLKGEITEKGVKPPEQCINPSKFLSYLTQKNITLLSTYSETVAVESDQYESIIVK